MHLHAGQSILGKPGCVKLRAAEHALRWAGSADFGEGGFKPTDCALDVVQLVEPEKANAETPVVGTLVTLQWDAGGSL